MTDLLAAARVEAARLQHDYVGTEHLVLALIQTGDPSLSTILTAFSSTPAALRERLEKRSPQGKGAPATLEEISLRSGAKRALDMARAAAQGGEPGPQELLGALMAEQKGVVSASLGDLGIPVAKVREALGIEAPAPSDRDGSEKPARTERPERGTRHERGDRPERQEKQEKGEKPERPPKGERRERAERPKEERPKEERRERGERGDRRERESRGREREHSRAPSEEPAEPVSRSSTPPRIAPVHEPVLTWRKLPLLAIPASLYLAYGGDFPALWVFIAACVAVLPLAGYMGEATEHLAARTGPALGGLLNATFGNAAELIIAIVALQAGKVELVKASITGSIIGNLLLILGLSLIAGGLNKTIVRFNRTNAGMSAGMMALAVTSLVFPTLFHGVHQADNLALTELHLSESVAVVLAVTYGFSLLFALKTHKRILSGDPHPTEGVLWSVPVAIGVLALATAGVALESEILVHAVEGVTAGSSWLSETFLGLIVIPIIGNAAEHATAVLVARKGSWISRCRSRWARVPRWHCWWPRCSCSSGRSSVPAAAASI